MRSPVEFARIAGAFDRSRTTQPEQSAQFSALSKCATRGSATAAGVCRTYALAWAPLSEICPDQATPELMELSARLGSLMPYRKAADVLAEFLPDQNKRQFTTVRHRTLTIGRRLEDRTQQRQWFDPPVTHDRCQQELPLVGDLDREFVISIDTAHVPRLKREGGRTFEVAIGHCARGGRGASPGAVFALADMSGRALRNRALRVLDDQGYVGRGDITVISDGAEFLKRLPKALPQPATHIIDWFHIAMKIQPLQQIADGLARREDEVDPTFLGLSDQVRSLRWRLWHGQVDRAIALAGQIDRNLAPLRRNRDSTALRFTALFQPLRTPIFEIIERRSSTMARAIGRASGWQRPWRNRA